MLRVLACVSTEHDVRLVALAAVICLFATFTAFVLAGQLRRLRRARRMPWLSALAIVTGTGIWATHFIAMLAYQPHMPTGYAPALTGLSILIAIVLSGVAWQQTLRRRRGRSWLAGLLFTIGIAAMHFTGMAAMQISGRIRYDFVLVAGAALVGWAAASFAVERFRDRHERLPFIPAIAFSAAICALHFGAMAAAAIHADPSIAIADDAVDKDVLAMIVCSLIVLLLGFAMASALVESRIARRESDEAERLKQFTEGSLEGLAILDGDRVIEANRIFWSMIGADPDAPPATAELEPLLPDTIIGAARDQGARFRETELRRWDGATICVDVAIRDGSYRGERRAMLVLRDISERKAAAARIAHLASHDPLTGAANRLAFAEALAAAMARSSAATPLALLCLDLDRFKAVNDVYGHLAGDAVLVEVTRRVRTCLEADDLLARLGGDEFVILQPHGDQPHGAGTLAERIVAQLAEPFEVGGTRLEVGGSIGIALHPLNADSADELHRKADVALYRAKAEGRGDVRFFDAAMDEALLRHHRMTALLRGAAAAGELHVHYQPLASLREGDVVGFEALLRWESAELGNVPPSAFIPLAEESGSIVPIGEWVLRAACREAAGWPRPLKIAVNLSPVQFSCGDLAATVAEVLAETGLDPKRLELEITEGVLIKNVDRAVETLNRLKAIGVSIAMDDFGTGYSSLSYFRSFPFDKVKIDQSFVRDMDTNPQAMAIVRAVIGLGKTLGMSVLAEGVETAGQISVLQEEGCELIQGYAVSRPATIETFEAIVGRRADGSAAERQAA